MDTQPQSTQKESGPAVHDVPQETPKQETPPQPPVVKEIHHHHYHHNGFSLWRFAIGLMVIYAGVSLMAHSFGWHWAPNVDVWRLWPVFIILVGLSILTRRSRSGIIIGIILVLAVVGIFASTGFNSAPTRVDQGTNPVIAGVTAADVHINTGATSLTVKGTPDQAFFSRFESNANDLGVDSHATGTTQEITYSMNQRDWTWFSYKNLLEVHVPTSLPTELTVNGGAMTSLIDLTGVQATRFTLHAGASTNTIIFGDTVATSTALIEAGASTINVTFPKTVGVRLHVNTGASSKSLPDLNKVGDDVYESAGFATATHTIDCTIKAGASSISVHWQ